MNQDYKQWLSALKGRIQSAQIKAALKVNGELIILYWELGQEILNKEAGAAWGKKLLPQLSNDLRSDFPEVKGFSLTNLKYIRLWVKFYLPVIGQQVVDELQNAENQPPNTMVQQTVAQIEIVPQVVAQIPALFTSIPWGHHLQIITKCKTVEEAFFYINETANHSWSRAALVHQIESSLYKRKGGAITNFETTLPQPQSDLAHELLKNPYNFDFLMLGAEAKEGDLEDALIQHITSFLLELGQGFAYMGRQYKLRLEGEEYFLDLLFYHTRLRCHVVIELKADEFKPEYAGKLNFYLNVVDDFVRGEGDKPTIGMLLCRTTGGKLKVEYALRGIDKPIGVSEYQLTESLPEELRGSLPTIEQIEEELNDID